MNVDYRTLKRWANNFGIKCRGLARWEIEDLLNEEIEYRLDSKLLKHTVDKKQLKWHRWWNSEMPSVDIPMPKEDTQPEEGSVLCSFCGKSDEDVNIITGPAVAICEECITLCADLVKDGKGKPKEKSPSIYCGNLYKRKLRIR